MTPTVRNTHTQRIALAALAVALIGSVAACGTDAMDGADPEHRNFALEGRALTVDSDDSALELVSADDDGAIRTGLPREASYRVETKSGDGSVDVSVPRDEGGSPVVTAHTRDGSVTVRNLG